MQVDKSEEPVVEQKDKPQDENNVTGDNIEENQPQEVNPIEEQPSVEKLVVVVEDKPEEVKPVEEKVEEPKEVVDKPEDKCEDKPAETLTETTTELKPEDQPMEDAAQLTEEELKEIEELNKSS